MRTYIKQCGWQETDTKAMFCKQSQLLYNFICDNDSFVTNITSVQSVNYTYREGEVKSYLDHVILSQSLRERVLQCNIIVECADNVGDHLSIHCSLTLPVAGPVPTALLAMPLLLTAKFPKVNWKESSCRERYLHHITRALQSRCLI